MTNSELKFLEDFTGYRFRGDFTPEALNSGKVAIECGDMFHIIGAPEWTALEAGHLYVRNGDIVRYTNGANTTYKRFTFVSDADADVDEVKFEHFRDDEGVVRHLNTTVTVPAEMMREESVHKLLMCIIKRLTKKEV